MTGRELPRGVVNRNPLNIEHRQANDWIGLADPPSDGRYCRFIHPIYGLRAALRIFSSYERRGIVKLDDVIHRWAPESDDNPTDNYIQYVCVEAGVVKHTYVLKSDKLAEILHAMAHFELGLDAFARICYAAAIELFRNEVQ